MRLGFVILIVLLAGVNADDPEFTVSAFQNFLMNSGLALSRGQLKQRMSLYRTAAADVRLHNSIPDRTFDMGLNQFSIMTPAERQQYLGVPANRTELPPEERVINVGKPPASPASKDHVAKGIIPAEARQQGQCGSGWAFAATAAFEGVYAAAMWHTKSFSEQELLDCSFHEDYDACEGGKPRDGFAYIKSSGHLALRSATGYTPVCGACNHGSKPNGIYTIKVLDWTTTPPIDEFLEGAIAVSVPTVAIQIDNDFFGYHSGIYDGCPRMKSAEHHVTAVGYDQNSWKIRNSWGSTWGEAGYIRMSRARPNICRIADYVMYPNVQLLDDVVYLRNYVTGRYISSATYLDDIRESPVSGAYGSNYAYAADGNYNMNAVWRIRPWDSDANEWVIEHLHSGRVLHSDGDVVRDNRFREGGWTVAPHIRLTDANYYDRAIWKKNDWGGGLFQFEHKYSGRYLFAAGSNEWNNNPSGNVGSERVVGCENNYYDYALWKIIPVTDPERRI